VRDPAGRSHEPGMIDPPSAEASPAALPAGSPASSPASDPGWQRAFYIMLAVFVLAITSVAATRPMVTYRALALGASPFEVGLVQSAFSLLPALTAVAVGRWVDRVGEGRVLALGMVLMSIGSLSMALNGSLLLLGVGQVVMGLGQVLNLVCTQAIAANWGSRDGREGRFGWHGTAASLGQLAGPAIAAALVGGAADAQLAGIADASGAPAANAEAPVFLFTAIGTAIAFTLAMLIPPRSPRRAGQVAPGPAPGMLRAAWIVTRRPGMVTAMVVAITIISSIDVLIAYLPAYGEAVGLSVATVGALLSIRGGATLISRLFMTRLIAALGRERLLSSSMAVAGLGFLLLPLVGATPLIFVLMALIGLGLGLGQPMTIAWIANRAPRRERALALGVRLMGNRAALVVTPTLMGALAGATGLVALWITLALVLGSGALAARRSPLSEPRDAPPGEQPRTPA
jgi:MFS family permease